MAQQTGKYTVSVDIDYLKRWIKAMEKEGRTDLPDPEELDELPDSYLWLLYQEAIG